MHDQWLNCYRYFSQVRLHTVLQQYNPEATQYGAAMSSPDMMLCAAAGGDAVNEKGLVASPGGKLRNRKDVSLEAVVQRARSRCVRGTMGNGGVWRLHNECS